MILAVVNLMFQNLNAFSQSRNISIRLYIGFQPMSDPKLMQIHQYQEQQLIAKVDIKTQALNIMHPCLQLHIHTLIVNVFLCSDVCFALC